ncbi:unnamed protein product [Protopolystoma xenopodis]|uniref:Uncharacterized protein n=1 Tax=Protopolystoma xenopodis TaxID=117903 RepID=A0A3S5BSM0_9PLAT|nr:unnamed protein product [Protopolystoma xenopodis]
MNSRGRTQEGKRPETDAQEAAEAPVHVVQPRSHQPCGPHVDVMWAAGIVRARLEPLGHEALGLVWSGRTWSW